MTDHHPVIPILNPYLRRLKEKVSLYIYMGMWCTREQLCIPDILSRAPVSWPTPEDET
ncbi:hypothetical protein SK128_000069, partial [Halocaridina rubra]